MDLSAEVERLFDDSSLAADGQPVAVILAGGVAAGKTTMRKRDYSTGYVLIDAADIFLSLSRGEITSLPGETEEPMDRIGRLVARRALSERRNIVTEIIGAEPEEVAELVEALKSLGYTVKGAFLTCDARGGPATQRLTWGRRHIRLLRRAVPAPVDHRRLPGARRLLKAADATWR